MSDLDFLDDLDDAGGHIAANNTIRYHTFRAPSPIIGASGLTPGERKARSRPLADRPRRDETWRDRAACVGLPVDWWVPAAPEDHGRGRPIPEPAPQAVAMCADCPVRSECLAYAVEWNEQGYWGGLTEVQRRRLRRTGTAA